MNVDVESGLVYFPVFITFFSILIKSCFISYLSRYKHCDKCNTSNKIYKPTYILSDKAYDTELIKESIIEETAALPQCHLKQDK